MLAPSRNALAPVALVRAALLSFALAACGDYSSSYAPPANPAIIISTPSPALTVTQGERVALEVAITRSGGFAGGVTLAVAGAPAGVAVDVGPTPVSANSATLTINVGDAVAPGVFRLTITATASGVETRSIPLDVTVSRRTALTVDVAYCAGLQPAWLAFQDGDGAWTRTLPVQRGNKIVFTHTFTSNRGAVATTQLFGAVSSVGVQYGAPPELASVGDTVEQFCTLESKTLLGTVAGLDTNETAFVNAGFLARDAVNPGRDDFLLRDLPAGREDILATRTTRANGGGAITAMILRRTPDLPDGTILSVFDFHSEEAFAPATATLTIDGLGGDVGTATTQFRTPNSRAIVSLIENAAHATYYAIPESRLQPNDLQAINAQSSARASNQFRSSTLYFRAPIDQTIGLGPMMPAPALSTVARQPALRMRAQFVAQPEYDRMASIAFQQASRVVAVSMTSTFAALTGAGFDLVIPDFSGVDGFDSAWTLSASGELFWQAGRIGGSLGLGFNAVPVNGSTQRTASVFGTISPQ